MKEVTGGSLFSEGTRMAGQDITTYAKKANMNQGLGVEAHQSRAHDGRQSMVKLLHFLLISNHKTRGTNASAATMKGCMTTSY
jgi:hypothetical protein